MRRARSAAGAESASWQPAARFGSSTVRDGLTIFAVSAMKWTPQNSMTSASRTLEAISASSSESPTKSATFRISGR